MHIICMYHEYEGLQYIIGSVDSEDKAISFIDKLRNVLKTTKFTQEDFEKRLKKFGQEIAKDKNNVTDTEYYEALDLTYKSLTIAENILYNGLSDKNIRYSKVVELSEDSL